MDTIKDGLYQDVRNILAQARANAVRAVNFSMVLAYWEIGKRIVEEEQQGSERARYGEAVLKELSKKLTLDFGRGFTVANLEYFRKFFLVFSEHSISDAARRKSENQKFDAVRRKLDKANPVPETQDKIPAVNEILRQELSWTHYRLLMRVKNKEAREYYMNEAAGQNWSTRVLERQINSLYFERLLSSKNKQALLKHTAGVAKTGQALGT